MPWQYHLIIRIGRLRPTNFSGYGAIDILIFSFSSFVILIVAK
jgi:hypothetical protein